MLSEVMVAHLSWSPRFRLHWSTYWCWRPYRSQRALLNKWQAGWQSMASGQSALAKVVAGLRALWCTNNEHCLLQIPLGTVAPPQRRRRAPRPPCGQGCHAASRAACLGRGPVRDPEWGTTQRCHNVREWQVHHSFLLCMVIVCLSASQLLGHREAVLVTTWQQRVLMLGIDGGSECKFSLAYTLMELRVARIV